MGLAGQLCVLGQEPWFGALSAHSRIWHFFGLALGSFAGVRPVGRPVPERPQRRRHWTSVCQRPVPTAVPPVEAGSVVIHVANEKTKLQRGK